MKKVWSNPVFDFCPMGVFGLKWPWRDQINPAVSRKAPA